MTTETITPPKCKTQNCKRDLTYLEKTGCWRCLICNPLTTPVKTEEPEKKLIDVKPDEERVVEMIAEQIGSVTAVTEDRIREIVQDELMNWHIQKPPVTRDEIGSTTNNEEVEPKPETWRQQAKRLGISLHQESGGVRKKVDVLADIAAKETEGSNGL